MTINTLSACGKTTFVKDLLQHHGTRIQPTIQRIVWLYKRWQPLYTIIESTVKPRVEFIQGIPSDLDDDDFFDYRVNNLLVLDDLFAEAGKDKRITGLFTEGSHHRSLSVIAITQNLYGTKDPTQRRNSHYLVIFKTSIDAQAIMTLARQMYPGCSDVFMNVFTKATKAPYGYMLVDLKPFTPEKERLQHKVTWPDEVQGETKSTNQRPEWYPTAIKEGTPTRSNHLSVGYRTVSIDPEETETIMSEKGNACDDCGLLFDTSHDVQRHVKRGWCTESQELPTKKRKLEEQTIDSESMESVEDNEAYLHMWKLAKRDGSERYKELCDKYVAQGEDDDDASEMAAERVKPYEIKSFLNRYSTLLETYWLPLQNSPLHVRVLRQIQALTQKGVPVSSAITRVLRKHKPTFEDLFDTVVSEDEQESDEDSTDGATDGESDI